MSVAIQRATEADLPEIASLAGHIWRNHYPGIISHEQIEYMLERMFDLEVMKQQIAGGTVFELLHIDGALGGFSSYAPTSTAAEFKLDKLYVHERFRGKGLGRLLLNHSIESVRNSGANSVILAVNKKNTRAITMYERNGFCMRESVVNDIGGGFVMDDYLMERTV